MGWKEYNKMDEKLKFYSQTSRGRKNGPLVGATKHYYL